MKKPPSRNELFTSISPCVNILFPGSKSGIVDAGALMSVTDDKGRYQHWDDICNKYHSREKALAHWSLIHLVRDAVLRPVPTLGCALGRIATFMLLPSMQKTCSLIDRNCTAAGLSDLIERIQIPGYALDDFIGEESIASSQLEGASTTRTVARKMLAENRSARNESEKMILGNSRLMRLAWKSRLDDMSMELLLSFHREAVRGIDDEKYHPGQIRTGDDVWVEGRDGEVVHTPPPASELEGMLNAFIAWINYQHAEDTRPHGYLHPVIKACIIHFGVGYLHPFRDGNGRVARALCYWYLFRNGYDAFQYISISRLLKDAPVQYGEAYLKTETDNQDVTYFVEYQCRILERAVTGLIEHARTVSARLRDFDLWVFNSGIKKKMPDIHREIIAMAITSPGESFTVKNLAARAGISDASARQHLESLSEAGLLIKQGGGGSRPVLYTPRTSFMKMQEGLKKMYL